MGCHIMKGVTEQCMARLRLTLLDTKSNDLQYVQCLQLVVDDYYDMHTKEVVQGMSRTRKVHMKTLIQKTMYKMTDTMTL